MLFRSPKALEATVPPAPNAETGFAGELNDGAPKAGVVDAEFPKELEGAAAKGELPKAGVEGAAPNALGRAGWEAANALAAGWEAGDCELEPELVEA